MQIVTQWVWGGAQDSMFQPNVQVVPMQLVCDV